MFLVSNWNKFKLYFAAVSYHWSDYIFPSNKSRDENSEWPRNSTKTFTGGGNIDLYTMIYIAYTMIDYLTKTHSNHSCLTFIVLGVGSKREQARFNPEWLRSNHRDDYSMEKVRIEVGNINNERVLCSAQLLNCI